MTLPGTVEGLFALADKLELRLAKARGQVGQITPSLYSENRRAHVIVNNAAKPETAEITPAPAPLPKAA